MNRPVSNDATLREHRISTTRNNSHKFTPVAKVAPAQQKESPMSAARVCAVPGCEHYQTLPDSAFFRFPEEASLRSLWTEVTGRSGWTPAESSYVCQVHFEPDCVRGSGHRVALQPGSVPTLKLPHHMEVEYIDEEILDTEMPSKESEPDDALDFGAPQKSASTVRLELLQLFTQVQNDQNQIVNLRKRLLHDKQTLKTRNKAIKRLQAKLRKKEKELQKKAGSKNAATELNQVMVMPTRYTDDVKNLALNIYSYSSEAYIYLRNTLRTVLPSTEVLDEWLASGYKPKKVMSNTDCLKVVTEAKPTELSCKVSIA